MLILNSDAFMVQVTNNYLHDNTDVFFFPVYLIPPLVCAWACAKRVRFRYTRLSMSVIKKKCIYDGRIQSWLFCCYIVAERMSERAEDDVRGEQRRAARQQLKQQQIQRGEGSTAMATVAERRSLPSPEIMLGQPWSNWVDAAKLHGHDGEFPSVPYVGEEAR